MDLRQRQRTRGDLASLLARIKRTCPDDYQHYFGRFGLEVDETTEAAGWVSLEGLTLRTKADKEHLSENLWAYRFATAGADTSVQVILVAHAVGRIRQFYPARIYHRCMFAGHKMKLMSGKPHV